MRVNMPVTDHEIIMQPDDILVTRTNLKGVITYANDAFVTISGFTREELVGNNHNIVRHPDMPSAAYEDMWQCLKAGRPWTAPVKNRTKSGDFYWVEANVTPVIKNGKVVEYLSVRYAPSREQIASAETLYQKLNAQQASLRPVGVAKWLKSIREISLTAKTTMALILFWLALAYLIYLSLPVLSWPVLSGLILAGVVASALQFHNVSLVQGTLSKSIDICHRLADEKFRNIIDLNRNDRMGDFLRAQYSMQVKLNSDMAYTREIASHAMRIKQALDNVQSNVMVADQNLNIIYMNKSVQETFNNAQDDIRTQLKDFDASQLLGSNIDQFHKNPQHQRTLLAKLNDTFTSALVIGGRHMNLTVNPVLDENQNRIGTVVEWLDRTQEVKIEKEIQSIVDNVKAGILDQRVDLTDKEGFFLNLSESINELSEVVENVITTIATVMSGVAEGDLTGAVEGSFHGLYEDCQMDINNSLEKLTEVFNQVREASDFIRNTAQEIASGNNNLSQRVETQAASLEQTASSMEQLTSTVKANADNAQQANDIAHTTQKLAVKGGSVVESAVEAMSEINQSSNKIADIIGVIDEIAFQTNLLALNASVEAARAGEHGRGFSVVATEVRNLAQRSAVAAKESKELIQSSVQKVRSGTSYVNETGAALTEIVASVKKVNDIIAEIAAASTEQAQGITQVNQAVAQMDEITQQNAALAEQASAASVSMSEQAVTMANLLRFFKMKEDAAAQLEPRPPLKNVSNQPTPSPAKPKVSSTPKVATSSSQAMDDGEEWEEF
ncbi:MAG: methyl-accepting chemotaxis protein [Methylococcales bacterium]|nr:methyl-accepting chemotaxis protein [Methylococcales bacterium]